jgi:hypothetical protein
MYLFFDTKTIGITKKPGSKFTDIENWPRVTQLTFQVYNAECKMYKSFSKFVKPNGWEIPKDDKFFIQNRISQEFLLSSGFPIEKVLEVFKLEINSCKYFISHDLEYDKNVVLAEYCRIGALNFQNKPINICVQQISIDVVKKPAYGNTTKLAKPSLTDLNQFLFGVPYKKSHDSPANLSTLAKCFFAMKRKNLIQLPV